jgi:phosphatidylglycerophosphate synthase/putative flippase GtrA
MSELVPPLALVALVGVAVLLYARRNRVASPFHDEEMDQRGQGGLSTPGLRHFFAWLVRPLWRGLARLGFPPDVLTTLSLAIALGAAAAVAAGRFALGGWLLLGSGLLDFLDGRVARAENVATRRGAVLDSVLDRYVESAFLIGLCWYYRGHWPLAAGLLALSGSLLVPYVRARGEALKVRVDNVGRMQRTERVLLLGFGTALSPAVDHWVEMRHGFVAHPLTVAALVVLALTSHVSAAQRMRRVLRELDERADRGDLARPLKSIAANAAATVVDFGVASALYFWFGLLGYAATAAGCAAGGLVSFTLSRAWAFDATHEPAHRQLDRYVFVSAVTLALNAGGVAVLSLLGPPFVVAWLIARAVVFCCFSYPAQRDFVFVVAPRPRPRSSLPERGFPANAPR